MKWYIYQSERTGQWKVLADAEATGDSLHCGEEAVMRAVRIPVDRTSARLICAGFKQDPSPPVLERSFYVVIENLGTDTGYATSAAYPKKVALDLIALFSGELWEVAVKVWKMRNLGPPIDSHARMRFVCG